MSQFKLYRRELAVELAKRLAPLQAVAVTLDQARLDPRMNFGRATRRTRAVS